MRQAELISWQNGELHLGFRELYAKQLEFLLSAEDQIHAAESLLGRELETPLHLKLEKLSEGSNAKTRPGFALDEDEVARQQKFSRHPAVQRVQRILRGKIGAVFSERPPSTWHLGRMAERNPGDNSHK